MNQSVKRYKFELGGSYTYYWGETLGTAIEAFIKDRGGRLWQIRSIEEEPLKEYERQ